MKRKRMAIIVLAFVCVLVLGAGIALASDDDWVTSSGNTYVTSGSVGIGTTAPTAFLDVVRQAGAASQNVIRGYQTASASWAVEANHSDGPYALLGGGTYSGIFMDGNVGIGTSSPDYDLHIENTGGDSVLAVTDTSGIAKISVGYNMGYGLDIYRDSSGADIFFDATQGNGKIRFQDAGTDTLTIDASGNVGIGTTSPDYELDVCGTIRAEEVIVDDDWCDFVFEDNYQLPSLDDVELYIKENRHLPDIPSAKQVAEEGLSMAEIMAKQMQKIEELTLYMIEQNKEMEAQNKEIESLKKELAELKGQM